MKVQELRIDNLIYSPITKEIVTLVAIEQGNRPIVLGSKGTSSFSGVESLRPIELTEEWLLKLGFKVKDRKSHLNTDIFYIPTFEIDYCLFYADFRLDYGLYVEYTDSPFSEDDEKLYPITFGIKYVHQLQNLIYSLTGEELTIKQE